MKDQDYIAFEDYLKASMPDEEKLAFENRLQTDKAFQNAFTTYKEASRFLKYKFGNGAASTTVENTITSISSAYFEKVEETKYSSQKPKVFKLAQWAVAASIVVFLGLFAYNQFTVPSYDDYSDYKAISLTVRSNNNEVFTKAEKAFNSRNFSEAETYFNQILEYDENNVEVQLYKAICQIEQDKFSKADTLLGTIASGHSAFRNDAIWYSALSQLKQGNNKGCIAILKSLPEETEHYRKAQKLIDKLD